MRKLKVTLGVLAVSLVMALVAFPLAVSAAPAGATGLTAKIVANTGDTISGVIDATGFDIGIYIGPGVTNVTVNGATVSGANDEGILVQDTANIVIKNSTIQNNGLSGATHGGTTPPALTEDKAIVLAGTSNCQVMSNIVQGNGHGGISVLDDGLNHPFALNTVTTAPIAGTGNTITGNTIKDNLGDCGIVVSGKNAGGGVNNTTISNNTVIGFNPPTDVIPGVGGIVLGTGAVGPSTVTNTAILNNNVSGGFLPGISLHCFDSGVISGTLISGNVLSNNGSGEFSGKTTGIEIAAVGPKAVIAGTQVLVGNTFSNDYYGVWGKDTVNDVPASSALSIALTVSGLAGVMALVIFRRSRKLQQGR